MIRNWKALAATDPIPYFQGGTVGIERTDNAVVAITFGEGRRAVKVVPGIYGNTLKILRAEPSGYIVVGRLPGLNVESTDVHETRHAAEQQLKELRDIPRGLTPDELEAAFSIEEVYA